MPASAAALEGISANGLSWRHTISGAGAHSARFAELVDAGLDTPERRAEAEACVEAIVSIFTRFSQRRPELHTSCAFDDALEWLRENKIDDEPEAWVSETRAFLNDLWDWADYWRVLVR